MLGKLSAVAQFSLLCYLIFTAAAAAAAAATAMTVIILQTLIIYLSTVAEWLFRSDDDD